MDKMDKYVVKGTFKEPTVMLDPEKGMVKIEGNSIPEKTLEFYLPIIEWVESYVQQPAGETTIHFKLTYYNSSTKKFLLDILNKIARLHKDGKKVTFNWYYEDFDDEMEDAGIHYGELSGIPVNLISYEDE